MEMVDIIIIFSVEVFPLFPFLWHFACFQCLEQVRVYILNSFVNFICDSNVAYLTIWQKAIQPPQGVTQLLMEQHQCTETVKMVVSGVSEHGSDRHRAGLCQWVGAMGLVVCHQK
jgi:hypothetical protein